MRLESLSQILSCHFASIFPTDANTFIKTRDHFMDAVEVKDPGAPVDFFMNGRKVSKDDPRCEYTNLGEGRHQLVVHNIKMEDGTLASLSGLKVSFL